MGRIPRITHEEQMQLAAAIAVGRGAAKMLAKNFQDPTERKALEEQVRAGHAASEALFHANLRLALHLARQFQHRGLPLADLIQEANIGLLTAVERFDHTLGNHFSTYAFWWIRQALSRALAERGRLIRLPPHVGDTLRKIERARSELSREGHDPTPPELAAAVGKKAKRVEQLLRVAVTPQSLDTTSDREDQGTERAVADPQAPDVADEVADRAVARTLHAALQSMPPRERYVLARHFGLDGGEPAKLAEVARAVGLSRERVRQIEATALGKLRTSPSVRDLRSHL
jgi:RNA polymerase primary sigma factor